MNLLHNIFEIHLYNTLQHDIGLNWLAYSRLFSLGISAMLVEFKLFKNFPLLKHSRIVICQTDLKKSLSYPSVIGLLLLSIWIITASTSFLSNDFKRSTYCVIVKTCPFFMNALAALVLLLDFFPNIYS